MKLCSYCNKIGLCTFRSSHQRCSVKKGVLISFGKLTGEHLCQSLFFNKVAGFACLKLPEGPAALLKKRIWHRCFPLIFAKFLITPFYRTSLGRPLRNWTSEVLSNRISQSFTEPLDPSHRDGYIQKQLFGGVL